MQQYIIHTHLHNDHCENDYRCPNAEVFVQQRELGFFKNPHPIDHRYYPDVGPAVAPGVHIDAREAYDSIQKVRKIADILIPLHDIEVGRKTAIPEEGGSH